MVRVMLTAYYDDETWKMIGVEINPVFAREDAVFRIDAYDTLGHRIKDLLSHEMSLLHAQGWNPDWHPEEPL